MLEIQDDTKTQSCDAQVIQHQSTFMIADSVNHLCVYDDRLKRNQVAGMNNPTFCPS